MKASKLLKIISTVFFSFLIFLSTVNSAYAFRFVAWGDTKSGLAALKEESIQAKTLNPLFTLYSGDLTDSSNTETTLNTWKANLNGGTGNGMFDITFAVRGNHDGSTTVFPAYFDFSSVAARIGATYATYPELNTDLTYSFDYGNSHFVGIDVLGGVTSMSSAQITWLDNDLLSAERRGLKQAFLFWHGPVYPLAEHCCTIASSQLIAVLNKHPIISATFHGHEHVVAYTHMNSSRLPGLTHEFEEIVSGDAGAGPDTCVSGRFDYCLSNILFLRPNGVKSKLNGFVTVDVTSDTTFTVNYYAVDSVYHTKTLDRTMNFTKGVSPTSSPVSPTPTRSIATPTPTKVSTPTPTRAPTPTPTKSPTPTPNPTSTFSRQYTMVPAYFYPGNYWNQLITTEIAGDVAIVNPSNGPGTAKDTQYASVIQQAIAKGITVAGYVYTGYGTRDINVVKSDIDNYYNWYGVTAIFIDETSTNLSDLPYYQTLYQYIKQRNGFVIINPGTFTIEQYMNVSDVVMIVETSYAEYVNKSFPTWINNYPPSRFVHLIYATPDTSMTQAINLAKQRNAGFVYVTDDVLSNPWDTLPPYWNTEISQIHSGSTQISSTPTPSLGCMPVVSAWNNTSFANQTGTFTATFDAIPAASPNNDFVLALSDKSLATWTNMATGIRFYTNGNIEARDGGTYHAASPIPYTAGKAYHFRLVVNIPAHTYSAYVTPLGGSEVLIGQNYAFRSEQIGVTELNNFGAYSNVSGVTNSYCNLAVSSGNVTPTPTPPPQATPTPNMAAIGDATGDGLVTEEDYLIFKTNFGRSTSNKQADGDFDANGIVDGVDYAIWQTTYTKSVPTQSLPTPTTPISNCIQGSTAWTGNSFTNQTGSFTANFAVTPQAANENAVIGLSSAAATSTTAYDALAVSIRFYTNGNIEAYNGSTYSAASVIPYTANTTYNVRLEINVPTHRYSAYVSAPGMTEKTLASNYLFRGTQQSVTNLGYYTAHSVNATDLFKVCSFNVSVASVQPSPVPVASPVPTQVVATPTTTAATRPVYKNTVTGGSTGSTKVGTSSLVAASGNTLYLASISTKPNVSVSSISGLGLTWTKVRNQCGGNNGTAVEVWKAYGSPTTSGVVTATFTKAPLNSVIAVSSYSATATGNVVSTNTFGVNGGCSGGTNTSSYSANISAGTNTIVFAPVAIRLRTNTPGSGLTQRVVKYQGSGGDMAGIAIMDMPVNTAGTVTVKGVLNSTIDWALIALEIK